MWMLNNPESRLAEQMEFYIAPEEQEEFLHIDSPEELLICDPAVGSGHMLVYAFDLLYAIYEERGYQPSSIPDLILKHNLYGIEIDERAGALAAFALTMKARDKSRRFFRKPTQPNICVMENVSFKRDALNDYMNAVGKDLFTFDLGVTLDQFANAKHFGSLIRPELKDVRTVLESLREREDLRDDMFYGQIHNDVLKLLEMVDYLNTKYHVVVANPPYMGSRRMNSDLKDFLKTDYKDYKTDLFAAFAVRITEFTLQSGYIGLMMPLAWMFISSYEKFREYFIRNFTLLSLVQPEFNAFWASAHISITCFTLTKQHLPHYRGSFIKLDNFYGADLQPIKTLEAINNPDCGWYYQASASDFEKVPSIPIAYWVSDRMRNLFLEDSLEDITVSDGQNKTGDNNRFLRSHWEVSKVEVGIEKKWFFYAKGGNFRKWYGNLTEIVDWSDSARQHYRKDRISRIIPEYLWYRKGVTWSLITSAIPSFRLLPSDATFDVVGSSIFFKEDSQITYTLALLNTKIVFELLKMTNPTVALQVKNVREVPHLQTTRNKEIVSNVENCLAISKWDWDSYETSWDFTDLPLLRPEYRGATLADTYSNIREAWHKKTLEMQRLEEENNRIFIEEYSLQNELAPDVPLSEITLTCNPHYRYDSESSEEKLEARLLEDTMKEFISYAVGCMFGRYALEKEGLILANQGETRADYDRKVPNSSFPADEDNVIPILTENWFEDDIVERFGAFLRLTFGAEKYEENLRFIEEALGVDSIRDYFLRESRNRNISDFYENDHVKTYNKRPIYWLFASENNAFCALIYMHRYQPDTASVILTEYLREYRGKLEARVAFLDGQTVSESVSSADKTQALKDIEKYKAIIKELNEYERDVLYPLATEQRPMDLDDGVAVNYEAFGAALYEVKGLNK